VKRDFNDRAAGPSGMSIFQFDEQDQLIRGLWNHDTDPRG
jgi:hypothetical protein